jgi:murein DD-endopeptidase MepM/ murein hydrolase activator NlpD
VIAQADGIVLRAEDKHPDAPPGRAGGFDYANTVVVDYGGGIVGVYGHLKQGSAVVKAGDRVKAGQVLAQVGNSGASVAPHLHFTLTDQASFSLKGRFIYEIDHAGKWQLVDGKNLEEGSSVRNPAAVLGGHDLAPSGQSGAEGTLSLMR